MFLLCLKLIFNSFNLCIISVKPKFKIQLYIINILLKYFVLKWLQEMHLMGPWFQEKTWSIIFKNTLRFVRAFSLIFFKTPKIKSDAFLNKAGHWKAFIGVVKFLFCIKIWLSEIPFGHFIDQEILVWGILAFTLYIVYTTNYNVFH